MKKARVLKSWSKHNVPEDLWLEILSRLPVKSLLRFRCVSKSWRSLIDDPGFCHMHLKNFKNNREETHLLVIQGEERDCVVRCSNSFRTRARRGSLSSYDICTNTISMPPTLPYFGGWCFLCSIDGLVMLQNCSSRHTELMLWNPSIQKVRILPPSPACSSGMKYVDFSLGFDPLIKDYKHVRFVLLGYNSLQSVDVYTLGTGLWKTIPFQMKGCSSWHWCFFSFAHQTICFKGGLYFIARDQNSDAEDLVSFDLSGEVFAFTSLPKHCYLHDALISVDGGCSLALCSFSNTEGSIWVLESSKVDESMYWTKRYTFPMKFLELCAPGSIPGFLYFKKNGDLFTRWRKLVMSCNVESHNEKILLKNCDPWYALDVCCYIESLILLK